MAVAAIYDIHGNLPALEAVLAEIHGLDVDQIVVGGDVLPGPMPRATLTRLSHVRIPIHFIRGNGEVAVLAEMTGKVPRVPEQVREAIRWNARQLAPEDREMLSSWPRTYQTEVNGIGKVLFCHAVPQNEDDIFTRLTSEERLLAVFGQLDVDCVMCGHTHMQFDRTIGKVRVVNAGSIGMPFGKPGAYWVRLGPEVELRCTTYDLAKAAEQIRSTEYPQANDFAERNVLNPPSEEEMLKAFAGTNLKVLTSTSNQIAR
jgi:putative phosphoesterase